MPNRRILSLWFPRLAAEFALRADRTALDTAFAVIAQHSNGLVLYSLCPAAQAQGLHIGQSLSDARALCPNLRTRLADPMSEARFLTNLRRWATRYSPWIAEQSPAGLMLDISGCAHLFGGEKAMAERIAGDCEALRLTVHIGIGDTVGAAWALARYAQQAAQSHRNGDAIEQEARATRSRAYKRRNWERGGPAPIRRDTKSSTTFIAPIGKTETTLADLPLQALRLDPQTCAKLTRLGIRTVAGLSALPRGAIARRFGADTLRRIDQAFGIEPEPVCPAEPPSSFATRLSFPDPIGLADDIRAGLNRLLPPLCEKLRHAGLGARSLQLALTRTDHSMQVVEVSLARPSHDPDRIDPLLTLRLPTIEPGFGIDMMRLEAIVTEPLPEHQHKGHVDAVNAAHKRKNTNTSHADLLGRLGARIGLENLVVLHPADSHIPEKEVAEEAAAFASPPADWPIGKPPRPTVLFDPEPVTPTDTHRPPNQFKWRRRSFDSCHATGPERIAPEWWLKDRQWRNGTRDYWQIITRSGERLWIYQALGDEIPGGWFCHGEFG